MSFAGETTVLVFIIDGLQSDAAKVAANNGAENYEEFTTAVTIDPIGTTGTFLGNIPEGNPDELGHPQFIRRYLESKKWKPSDNYEEYRLAMLS